MSPGHSSVLACSPERGTELRASVRNSKFAARIVDCAPRTIECTEYGECCIATSKSHAIDSDLDVADSCDLVGLCGDGNAYQVRAAAWETTMACLEWVPPEIRAWLARSRTLLAFGAQRIREFPSKKLEGARFLASLASSSPTPKSSIRTRRSALGQNHPSPIDLATRTPQTIPLSPCNSIVATGLRRTKSTNTLYCLSHC